MEALEETIVRIEEKQLDVDVAVKQEQIKQLRSDMNELEDKYRTQWQIYGKLENDLRSHLNNH